jgi:hypothetical protein
LAFYATSWLYAGVSELAAAALELRVVVSGDALPGRGGKVLRAAGGSNVGVSVNKLVFRRI